MKKTGPLLGWLVLFLAVFIFARWKVEAQYVWPYTPLNELAVTKDYSGDLGVLMLGSHRLAGDIAYIQFLQYYGVPEQGDEDEAEEIKTPHFHDDTREGKYVLLKEFGTRILRLDPYFTAAILDVAGSLAFNQRRIDESLEVLKEGIERNPSFYRYRLYAAAILYRNKGDDKGLIRVLDEAINYPDCPPLLQQILGNLHKKYGHYDKAVKVYVYIIEHAAAEGDRETAKRKLIQLLKEHPDLTSLVPANL